MLTVRIQEKNYSESIMVLKLKDGAVIPCRKRWHRSATFLQRIWNASGKGSLSEMWWIWGRGTADRMMRSAAVLFDNPSLLCYLTFRVRW